VSTLPGSTFAKGVAARERLNALLQPRLVEQRNSLLEEGHIKGGGTKARCVGGRGLGFWGCGGLRPGCTLGVRVP